MNEFLNCATCCTTLNLDYVRLKPFGECHLRLLCISQITNANCSAVGFVLASRQIAKLAEARGRDDASVESPSYLYIRTLSG